MSLSKENDKKSLFSKYEEASKQKRNEDKKQNFMKINKINPEILTTINNIKESGLLKRICCSGEKSISVILL